jgi:thiol:disulfide interchange protein DsbD
MGAISALIVGPCVAAPLASALLYISQTHDVFIGGVALFSMAMGMSVPLILIGFSAGTLLPRVGRWMESVKQFFGVLMLGMALWMVSPLLPIWLQMSAWAVLLISYSLFLFRHPPLVTKVAALVLCTIGLIELVGVTTGGREVLAPFAHFSGQSQQSHVEFVRIKSNAELDKVVEQATLQGKPVMLDFYADWCVACKEMEKFTFNDERVRSKLAGMVLLQVDVTANNENDRALLKRFNLFGPPGILFFGLDSKETGRVIGFQNADKFVKSLSSFVK